MKIDYRIVTVDKNGKIRNVSSSLTKGSNVLFILRKLIDWMSKRYNGLDYFIKLMDVRNPKIDDYDIISDNYKYFDKIWHKFVNENYRKMSTEILDAYEQFEIDGVTFYIDPDFN